MSQIPSSFNRLDFIGLLLPGYVVVIAYVALFRTDLILGKATLSFDVLSAIIFIVAGPAAGIALRQAHHAAKALMDSRFGTARQLYRKNLKWYARIRLRLTDREKAELDEALAFYDCSVSLGTGFFLIDVAVSLSRGFAELSLILWVALAALLFFLTAYSVKEAYYNPLMGELARKGRARPTLRRQIARKLRSKRLSKAR
jgi:hypothetical protein